VVDCSGHAMTTSCIPAPAARHTKFQVPAPRPAAIERAHLLARLEHSSDRRVVLLCAPAGYGKSILAAQWSARDPRPAAWLHLDATDDDPVVLIEAIVQALDGLAPVEPELLAELDRRGPRIERVVLPLLSEELARREPFLLVLDDVHTLTDPKTTEVLSFLLDRFPAGSQLVLATRTEPTALRIARLRASGELLALRTTDLALSERETLALAGRSGVDLDGARVAALHTRSEGWAAGVALALLSWDGAPDAAAEALVKLVGERDVASYLLEEVLERQPGGLRRFLLETSVLDRMSAPLCDALLGRDDSARRLAQLERSNMFVVPLDRDGRWYRYHHLFGELLRAELERRSPKLVPERLQAAAAWSEEHGDPSEAFRYAHACGDLERAGRVAWTHANAMLARGHMATLRSWTGRITPEETAQDTQLALLVAWIALLNGDGATAQRAAAAAGARDDLDEPSADGASSLRSAVSSLRGTLAPDGISQMLHDGLVCCELERPAGGERYVDALRMVGTAHLLAGDPHAATLTLTEAEHISTGRPELAHLYVNIVGLLALAEADLGNWGRARRLAHDGSTALERSQLGDTILSVSVYTAHATVLAHEGLLARVPAELENIARVAGLLRSARWFDAEINLRRAQLSLGIGEIEKAVAFAGVAREALAGYPDAAALVARLEQLERRIASGRDLELTPSEVRLVPFLSSHLSLHEIGQRVHLSRATIKTHVSAIYRKLGASTRSQAVDRIEALGLAAPRATLRPSESPDSDDAPAALRT